MLREILVKNDIENNNLDIHERRYNDEGMKIDSHLLKFSDSFLKSTQKILHYQIKSVDLNLNLNTSFENAPIFSEYLTSVLATSPKNTGSHAKKKQRKAIESEAVTTHSEPATDSLHLSTDADKIADLKKIADFAANKPLFETYLDRLERQLQIRAGKSFSFWDRSLVGFSKYDAKPYKHNKLLSGFFNEWAKDNGFSGCEKITGDLTAQAFYDILAQKKLIKDKYARTYAPLLHGEDTHRIFWFCVGERYRDDATFLSCSPAELYAWIGRSEPQAHYWFDLCEYPDIPQQGYFNAQSSYGNVSALSHYLHSSFAQMRMPVLFQLITSREKKARLAQQEANASLTKR